MLWEELFRADFTFQFSRTMTGEPEIWPSFSVQMLLVSLMVTIFPLLSPLLLILQQIFNRQNNVIFNILGRINIINSEQDHK